MYWFYNEVFICYEIIILGIRNHSKFIFSLSILNKLEISLSVFYILYLSKFLVVFNTGENHQTI